MEFRNNFIAFTIIIKSISVLSADLSTCKKSSDCILTNENYCQRVTALNKNNLKEWILEQKKQDQENPHRTCSPIPHEDKTTDYKVDCVDKKCKEIRIKPWQTHFKTDTLFQDQFSVLGFVSAKYFEFGYDRKTQKQFARCLWAKVNTT